MQLPFNRSAIVIRLAVPLLLSAGYSLSGAQTASAPQDKPTVECAGIQNEVIAAKLTGKLDGKGFPQAAAWNAAAAVRFCSDWQGKNADPGRQTEVRVLWSADTLFLNFRAKYRELYTFPNRNQRRDQLWTRDVVEAFIQPETQSGHSYKEIEVSPNQDWLDLAINDGKGSDLNCNMQARVNTNEGEKIWDAEVSIPTKCIVEKFKPASSWHVNFFRVESAEPNRFYSSWRPTKTATPNFHVPEEFGTLHFSDK